MAQKYTQLSDAGSTRFSKAPMADVEFSRMSSRPKTMTTFNAGDIVPLRCLEVLPHDTFKVGLSFVNRLASAVIKPTMGDMQIDIYAYFVPNRIVNDSWVNVQGENTSGVWTAPEVSLAPLVPLERTGTTSIPVGSIADYYGLPTQAPIPNAVLSQMNDLKIRGYLSIYNEYFRDQNYEPPVAFSKLNVYNGFLEQVGAMINLTGAGNMYTTVNATGAASDGSYPQGAVNKALYGDGEPSLYGNTSISPRLTNFSALGKPLKANKLHDWSTSVLPSPQKGPDVVFGVGETAYGTIDTNGTTINEFTNGNLLFKFYNDVPVGGANLRVNPSDTNGVVGAGGASTTETPIAGVLKGTNMQAVVDLSNATGISVNDLRMALATQHVYEALARSGSRYISVLRALFDLDIANPMANMPTEIGHIRRQLDLFQVAQTSATEANGTAQGDLAAFGYTASGDGDFFDYTAVEHGYIHILAVVRHKQVYSTFVHPTWFRKNTLDWYLPQFANIGEQPISLATINPFHNEAMERVIGYQEAFWDYRYDEDVVSGLFRTGISGSLSVWNYADPVDLDFTHVNMAYLKSNSQEVLDRTLAVTSDLSDQFLFAGQFNIVKQRPMPTYSVPGMDTI